METECEECGGDGIARCDNPDHGFIDAVGGETRRLGCPVCGYDDYNRIRFYKDGKYHWQKCQTCDVKPPEYKYRY